MSSAHMKHIEELLPDYFHGDMDGAERATVEHHIRVCADCRRAFDEMQSLFEVARPRPITPSPGYFQSILPRVHARLAASPPRKWWTSPIVARLVLPFAVTIFVFVIIARTPELPTRDPLRPLLEDLSAVEMLDMVTEYASTTDPQAEDVLATLSAPTAAEPFIPVEVVRSAYAEGSTTVDPLSLVETLADDAFDVVLQRLDERTVITP